jgi:hypothetical protein
MDYQRIYAAFINDRMGKQPAAPEYSERHHIVPRALGGGDEAANMIRLTPEDHYFAHLLLAKIHGGHLWSCVLLLTGRRRYNTPWAAVVGKARYGYGLARRKHAEKERQKDGLKGADNGNYNATVYQWVNLDTGEKEQKTLHEMWRKYGGHRATWTPAASGDRSRPSAHGWALDDGTERLRSSKGKTFQFLNRDGRTFTGTQKAFCDMLGIGPAAGTRLVRHKGVTLCGWRLAGTPDRVVNAPRATGIPHRRGAGRVHRLVSSDGKVVEGKRIELAAHFGIQVPSMSSTLTALGSGALKHYRGYTIATSHAPQTGQARAPDAGPPAAGVPSVLLGRPPAVRGVLHG